MTDMTSAEALALNERLDKIDRSIERLTTRVDALPDKGAIYTAAFAVHALIWGTLIGGVGLVLGILNAVGAFN